LAAFVLATGCSTGSTVVGGSVCLPPNTVCAGGTCTNTAVDPANCGACGRVCAAGQLCAGGTCSPDPLSQGCSDGTREG
jgi:hypothetical protein